MAVRNFIPGKRNLFSLIPSIDHQVDASLTETSGWQAHPAGRGYGAVMEGKESMNVIMTGEEKGSQQKQPIRAGCRNDQNEKLGEK